GLATYALGHAVATLPSLMHHLHGWKAHLATGLASLIPNLGQFAYRNVAVHREPMAWSEIGEAVAYGALWIVLLVTITVGIFRRKQL
nr:hypothetical protein [Planctomycetota bacterium]